MGNAIAANGKCKPKPPGSATAVYPAVTGPFLLVHPEVLPPQPSQRPGRQTPRRLPTQHRLIWAPHFPETSRFPNDIYISDDISLCFHLTIKLTVNASVQSHPLFSANYSLYQAASHASSSAESKWPICQAGQLQLSRPGAGGTQPCHLGPKRERTYCWQPPGQAQSPRLC